MVALLLADPNGPPPLSLLPPPQTKAASGGKGTEVAGSLASLSSRPWNSVSFVWQQLVLLIAQLVGVAPEAIERSLPPADPPT